MVDSCELIGAATEGARTKAGAGLSTINFQLPIAADGLC
jgi:hypothetical protein